MKKQISIGKVLFLFLLFAGNIAKAQSLEFAPIGAEWHYEYQAAMECGYVRIGAVSDTLVEGLSCTKLQKERHVFRIGAGLSHFIFGCEYVAQIDDSVMIYRNGSFHKLFDFGSDIGDTWTVVGEEGLCEEDFGIVHVVGKGIEEVDGQMLRFVQIVDDPYSYWGYGGQMYGEQASTPMDTIKVFERIGPVGAYLLPQQKCLFDLGEGGSLRCYSDDILGYLNFSEHPERFCDYINEEYQAIPEKYQSEELSVVSFPNPCIDVLHIVLPDDAQYHFTIYDNLCNNIKHGIIDSKYFNISMWNYPSGVYFINISNGCALYTNIIIKAK